MIKLVTSDSQEPFFVNPEQITAMYRHGNFTMVHYAQFSGSATWAVKETPEQIAELGEIRLVQQSA